MLDLMEEAKEFGNDDENIGHVTREGLITGTVSVGGVTADDLQGQLKDKSLKDLYKSMVDGRIYVTVHTEDFPHGEIRGDSFIPIDRVFPDISDFRWN
ncbi:MAG: CHRD domain-containing protein [Nitrososphaeraceae archaeon]